MDAIGGPSGVWDRTFGSDGVRLIRKGLGQHHDLHAAVLSPAGLGLVGGHRSRVAIGDRVHPVERHALLIQEGAHRIGPFFAEHFEDAGDGGKVGLHAAGPIANLLGATFFAGVFLWRPAPLALLAATVNLAVAGYSLLPKLPMDGKVIGEEKPVLYTILTLLTAAAGAALVFAP